MLGKCSTIRYTVLFPTNTCVDKQVVSYTDSFCEYKGLSYCCMCVSDISSGLLGMILIYMVSEITHLSYLLRVTSEVESLVCISMACNKAILVHPHPCCRIVHLYTKLLEIDYFRYFSHTSANIVKFYIHTSHVITRGRNYH